MEKSDMRHDAKSGRKSSRKPRRPCKFSEPSFPGGNYAGLLLFLSVQRGLRDSVLRVGDRVNVNKWPYVGHYQFPSKAARERENPLRSMVLVLSWINLP